LLRTFTAAVLTATVLAVPAAAADPPPWMNTSLSPGDRANALLAAMTQAEKLTMLHGGGNCGYAGCVDANTRLGIPALRLQDGPLGVGDGATGVTQLAAPVAGAASWNTALMRQYGETLGAEQWGKGTNVVLAPTINIVRDPRWGRAFESFGEDPYLTGQMSAADIQGIQSQGPMAQVKHYAVYNQETRRNTTADNAVVSDRAEREIYLPAFETSVKQGGADSVMCSYSAINGPFACENGPLQNQVLKSGWGFDGFVTSDWGATHSTVASANNGLDMEMPGASYYGSALTNAVAGGQVSQATMDDHVRRVLTPMFRRGLFDRTQTGSMSATVTSAAHAAVTRQVAAEGSVLLKNANAVLPVPAATKSIAVIGTPLYQGGGSAGVNPSGTVSPLQGIQARAGSGVTVTYNPGTAATGITGLGGKCIDVAAANTANGTTIQLYDCNGTNAQTWTVGSDQTVRALGKCMTAQGSASGAKVQLYDCNGGAGQKWTATGGTLVNQGLCLDATGSSSANGTPLQLAACTGAANQKWALPSGTGHDAAVTAARNAALAVVFVSRYESEGSDLADINLPAEQNQLVADVAAANPNTVVVVDSGSAVTMPWASSVRGIIESWYPGQEYGTAIASLLFGDVNPSGKLPVTFPASLGDVPAHTAAQWPGQNNTVQYSEGIDVGYRWYDRQNITPAFPFGFGLSYTTFGYANLAVGAPDAAGNVAVSFDVTNTGTRAGSEVAQVYVGQPAATGEPPKNLRGFTKVALDPGQTRRVTVTLDARSFQYWSGGWTTASGGHQILVGASSRDIRLSGSVTVGGSSATALPRTGWTASASPSSTVDVPARMLDGNTATRWSSGTPMTSGNTVTLDLAAARTFSRLVMDSAGSTQDYARGYSVTVSADGSTWRTAATGTGTAASVSVALGTQTARYLRITQTGSASSWWSIAELNLFP
jgi:beta-glucosidase